MVDDHGIFLIMESIAVSRFKATCLAVIEKVRKTGEPVVITKRGVPVAQLVPPPPAKHRGKSCFGCLSGTAEQIGDIVEPLGEEWEALR